MCSLVSPSAHADAPAARSHLSEIQGFMQHTAAQNMFKQMAFRGSNAAKLRDFTAQLDYCMQTFQVRPRSASHRIVIPG